MRSHDVVVYCDSLSDSIFSSTGTNPRLSNGKSLPLHSRVSSMLYGWCNTEVAALSPTFRCTYTLLFDLKILNFDSSVQMTLFHCSIVQSLWAFANWSFWTLFCFLDSGFLTAILPYGSASKSFHLTDDVDTFFHDIVSVVQWYLKQTAFFHAPWWLWWNCSLPR